MKLTHLRLLVTGFDECFRFYRDIMGFKVLWGAEGERYADFEAGPGLTLALFDRSEMAVAAGTADGLIATDDPDRSVLVIKADDLAADVELLENLGATFFAGVTDRPDWGIRTAHLRDPDGNVIELYEDLSE
jgi:catechol 2,3-dioxygenase-like lactoylglutathione lyase family enzyme